MELLNFQVQGGCYGVDLADVDEVLNMVALKPLPGAPDFVAGVLNLRGEFLPAIDLSARLGLKREAPTAPGPDGSPLSPYASGTRLLIVTADRRRFAVIIDGLTGIRRLSPDRIVPAVVESKGLPGFVGKIGRDDDGAIQLIDIRQMLRPDELVLLRVGDG